MVSSLKVEGADTFPPSQFAPGGLKLAVGQPFAPVLLNILVTSVCDMRCTHCFFTDELDDRPRKKLQMKTHEIQKISETLGGNLGVLITEHEQTVGRVLC